MRGQYGEDGKRGMKWWVLSLLKIWDSDFS